MREESTFKHVLKCAVQQSPLEVLGEGSERSVLRGGSPETAKYLVHPVLDHVFCSALDLLRGWEDPLRRNSSCV